MLHDFTLLQWSKNNILFFFFELRIILAKDTSRLYFSDNNVICVDKSHSFVVVCDEYQFFSSVQQPL